jgi:hypothetical protein
MDMVEVGMVEVSEQLNAASTRLRDLEPLVQPRVFLVALSAHRSLLELMAEQLRILGTAWHDRELA